MKLDLKRITAVGFFGRDSGWGQYKQTTERIDKILTYMSKTIDFAEIVMVSTYKPKVEGVKHIQIEPFTYKHNYPSITSNISPTTVTRRTLTLMILIATDQVRIMRTCLGESSFQGQ